MITLARVTVLGLFVSAGVGLALCLGLSANVSPDSPLADRHLAQHPDQVQGHCLEDCRDFKAAAADGKIDSGLSQQAATIPMEAVIVEPHPACAFQVSADPHDSGLMKAFEYLVGRLAPHSAGGAAAETVPAPGHRPKGGPVGEAMAGDQQQPAPSEDPGQPPAESKHKITRAAAGEGDDKLSVNIQNADIREVLEALSEQGNLNILASNSVQGTVSATLNGVDLESALEAILKSAGYVARREGNFVYVGTAEDFKSLEQSQDTIGTRVYRPNYVTAAELQQLIVPLVSEKVGVVSVSAPAKVGIASDDSDAGGNDFAGSEVVLVRDYEAVLHQIDQVVSEIDTRPMQVAIEAMILSVKLDDGNDFGVNFELLRDKGNIRFGWGTPLGTLADFEFDTGGLKFGFLDSSLGAFLDALESIGDTNVIATPRLMVLNKHRAEILIGEQLGYVSTTITETSSSQTVDFLDVGAQLRLRPFISSDGLIRMEVHPELSTGSVDVTPTFTKPNKEVTQVTTNIMVRDGCTVIIGGLMREELKTTATQVPLFGSLPLVGVAFRSKSETLERREIIVLITPRIVYEPETCEEGEQAAFEFHRRQATYAEKMSPLGKRSIARRYFRMAQNAWAAGDRRKALRFAEMAVHFDPLNRAAIDLRASIWLGDQQTVVGGDSVGVQHSPAIPLDGAAIAPWLLDDLEREPVPQPWPIHPLDPGIPGRHKDIQPLRSPQ